MQRYSSFTAQWAWAKPCKMGPYLARKWNFTQWADSVRKSHGVCKSNESDKFRHLQRQARSFQEARNTGLQGVFLSFFLSLFLSFFLSFVLSFFLSTVGQNNQDSRLQYWATRSSVRLFARTAHSSARTAHSSACSALLSLLARSAGSLILLTP